jgi:hypothetical protein
MSWYLHQRIVRVAEEASDDAAVAAADPVRYAEVLLDFMRRGVRGPAGYGVAMARYGRPEDRIHRILNATAPGRGVTLRSVLAILALGSPLAYVVAAAHPQQQPPAPPPPPPPAAAPQTSQGHPAPPPPPPPPPKPGNAIRRYMIVHNDNSTMSWDSNDPMTGDELRARYGRNFAWFRQNGKEYVVTDAGVLTELDKAMAPQHDVNRMQNEVNVEQGKVNVLQEQVNLLQNEVSGLQHQANRRQDLVNQIQAAANNQDDEAVLQKLREAIKQLEANKSVAASSQDAINRLQSQVNQEQAKVNAEQSKVNALQQKVNEAQQRASEEINRRVQEILDNAVRRGLVEHPI